MIRYSILTTASIKLWYTFQWQHMKDNKEKKMAKMNMMKWVDDAIAA